MVFYFVQRGETLYAIAKRYQTTVHAIVAANRLEDPNAICPGQALIIPRPGEVPSPPPGGIVHLVRQGETVFHLAKKFGAPPHDILRANQIAHPEFILPGQQLVIPERMEPGDDWPMLGRTPGRAGASPVVLQGKPEEGWSYTPRKNVGLCPSAPVVRYDRVYVGLGDGFFYAFDRTNGRVKWRVPAGDFRVPAGERVTLAAPAVFDGLAYFTGADGCLFAVDAYTGQHIWKVTLGASLTSPAVFDGVIYLGSSDEHVYAVEGKTGALAWKKRLGANLVHPVAVGDDRVYAMTGAGKLVAVDAQTGEMIWQIDSDPEPAPVFAEVILLAGQDAYDPKTGQHLWHTELGAGQPVVRVDEVIYPSAVVDIFAGKAFWSGSSEPMKPSHNSQESYAESGAAAEPEVTVAPQAPPPLTCHVATGTLVIGLGLDAHLYGWDVTNGVMLWKKALKAPASQLPAVAPGQLFVSLEDGSVRTYQFATE